MMVAYLFIRLWKQIKRILVANCTMRVHWIIRFLCKFSNLNGYLHIILKYILHHIEEQDSIQAIKQCF